MKILDIFKKYLNFRSSSMEISLEEAKVLLKENTNAVLVDVRSPQEYMEYHLNGAILIPIYELKDNANYIIKDKTKLIVVYCQYGTRSKKAVQILNKKGYLNVYNIKGGLNDSF